MARSKIEWLARPGTVPESWNLVGGCTKKGPECRECYACRGSWRIMGNPRKPDRYEDVAKLVDGQPQWTGRINLDEGELDRPLHWRKSRTVFVCSMADLFHKEVPFDFVDKVMYRIMECPQHTFLVLTKRAERMFHYFYGANITDTYHPDRRKHIWLGTTVGHPSNLSRLDWLLQTPAAVRFVSCEPLLGDLDLRPWLYPKAREMVTVGTGPNVVGAEISPYCPALDWVIGGGESGTRARPTHPEWAKWLKDQCVRAGVPYFWKQWGEWLPYPNHGDVAPEGTWTDEELAKYPQTYLATTGEQVQEWRDAPSSSTHGMIRVGKAKAGRLLDGKEWHQWPMT